MILPSRTSERGPGLDEIPKRFHRQRTANQMLIIIIRHLLLTSFFLTPFPCQDRIYWCHTKLKGGNLENMWDSTIQYSSSQMLISELTPVLGVPKILYKIRRPPPLPSSLSPPSLHIQVLTSLGALHSLILSCHFQLLKKAL